MSERTHDLPLPWWANNLEELDGEIARLAAVCQIEILEPGVVRRVLQKDAALCGTENPPAFAKLRNLLLLHGALRDKVVGVFGESQAAAVEQYVLERLRKRFPQAPE